MNTSRSSLLSVLLLSSSSLVACMDSPESTPEATEQAKFDTPPDAAPAAPPTIEFRTLLVDARSPDRVLAGVEVCAAGRADVPCAVSGADGRVTMKLPADSELMLRCQSGEYGPAYMTWTIGRDNIDAGTFSLLDRVAMNLFISFSGGSPSEEKGAITVNVYEDLANRTKRVAGAKFTITPKSGKGPTYVGAEKVPDPSATSSTEGGPGLFFDLDPGDVTITIEHPTRKCTGGFGWKTDRPTELRSRIFGGGLSNVTFVCPP